MQKDAFQGNCLCGGSLQFEPAAVVCLGTYGCRS
jgi:hypothetical protein